MNPKDFAQLALKTQYNTPHLKRGAKALKHLSQLYSWLIPTAEKKGKVLTYYESGNLKAYYLRINSINPMNQQKGTNIHTNFDPSSKKAKAWWAKTVKAELKKCPYNSLLHLGGYHLKEEKLFNSLGFHKDGIQLVGNVNKAIKAVQKRDLQKIKRQLREKGYRIRKMTEEKWATPLAKVVVDEFKKRPWHCRFAAHDEFKKNLAKRLKEYAKNPNSKANRTSYVWVVLKGNKPLGDFSTTIFDNGLSGKMGGMGFELGEELQGIGLGLVAYETIFKWHQKKGVKRFQGFTSNPAVLHLAREFGRVPVGFHFRKGKPHYPSEHFLV